MVRAFVSLFFSLVAADFDQLEMLQKSTNRHVDRNEPTDEDTLASQTFETQVEDILGDCEEWFVLKALDLEFNLCPDDICEELNKVYEEAESSLEDDITSLESDIEETEAETEKAEDKVAKYLATEARALKRAYRGLTRIDIINDKIKAMQNHTFGKMSMVQSYFDRLESTVNSVVGTAYDVRSFTEERLNTELLEKGQTEGSLKALARKIAINLAGMYARSVDKVLDFDVRAALVTMRENIAEFEETAANLKAQLDLERTELEAALEDRTDAYANKERAREYKNKVIAELQKLKARKLDTKQEFRKDLKTLKQQVGVYKVFLRQFVKRFGTELLNEMAKDTSRL